MVFFREARRAYLSVLNAGNDPQWTRVESIQMNIFRMATVDDDLAVRIRCDGVGRHTFRFRYLVRDRVTGETVAEASSVQALEGEVGMGMRVPQEFRARLMALEGRGLPELDSEVDDVDVVGSRFVG